MTDDTEIDPERLQRELDQIKGAMGIRERYPATFEYWAVYGLLVPVAAAVSQYVELAGLPGYWHPIAWFALMGLGGVYSWVGIDDEGTGTADAKPSIPLAFAAVFSYYLVVVVALSQVGPLDRTTEAALVFAMVVGLVGVAYLVVGNALRAYYIRRRDRFAMYVGGAWMVGLAAAIPVFDPLRTWGFAVYGALFGLYPLVTYVALSR